MSDRPIIFSAPMVRALLAGRKTQTRRLAKVPGIMGGRYVILPPEDAIELDDGEFARGVFHYRSTGALSGPYRLPAAVGDRLYVREAWSHSGTGVWTIADARRSHFSNGRPIYRATDNADAGAKFWPSIHMPREFSRLTLVVEGVKVEPLQAISSADATAEGVERENGDWKCYDEHDPRANVRCLHARESFASLWASLHAKPGERWEDNPQVVALTFRVVHGNIDQIAS